MRWLGDGPQSQTYYHARAPSSHSAPTPSPFPHVNIPHTPPTPPHTTHTLCLPPHSPTSTLIQVELPDQEHTTRLYFITHVAPPPHPHIPLQQTPARSPTLAHAPHTNTRSAWVSQKCLIGSTLKYNTYVEIQQVHTHAHLPRYTQSSTKPSEQSNTHSRIYKPPDTEKPFASTMAFLVGPSRKGREFGNVL